MYYNLVGQAPFSHEQLLLTETDPIFQVNLPILPPPGYKDSLEEIEYLLEIMTRKDFKDKLVFIKEADKDFLVLFLALLSELGIQQDREMELRGIMETLVVPIMKIKYHYNRARPFQYAEDAGIEFPMFQTQTGNTPSYPSGHTIQSYYIASYLSALYPQHRKIFMNLARDISRSRIQGGIHFPSDCSFGVTVFRHLWFGSKIPAQMKLASFSPSYMKRERQIRTRFQLIRVIPSKKHASSKKKVKNKDGDMVEIYTYTEKEINKRHKDKAKQMEKVKQNLDKLKKQLKEDLKNPEKQEVALAVSLIDETYERVGNPSSAKDGHFGVTGWQKKHLKFKDSKAVLSYIGKSGVEQSKTVKNKQLVDLLKKLTRNKKPNECILDNTSASKVNAYLKDFDITAKDIRGFHANNEMLEHLKQIRSKGPKLPSDKKEKEILLKKEFNTALEKAALKVGHEPATLKGQYLVTHLEESYLKDGTVIKSLKKASEYKSEYNSKNIKGVWLPLWVISKALKLSEFKTLKKLKALRKKGKARKSVDLWTIL